MANLCLTKTPKLKLHQSVTRDWPCADDSMRQGEKESFSAHVNVFFVSACGLLTSCLTTTSEVWYSWLVGMPTATRPVSTLLLAFLYALSLAAQDAASLYQGGLRLFSEHQPQAAIASLRQSVALAPANAAAWKALGVVYASQGDYESAEPAFRNACERGPTLPDACLYHGRALYLLDRFPAAIEALHRALAAREAGEAHRLLALSLEALARPSEAEPEFRAAIRLARPTAPDEDPGIDYGVFLYRQARPAQAIDPLRDALARHPDSARAHLELGCVLLQLDRLEEAATHLERSLALRDTPRTHQLLAKTYLRQGKADAAEPHLKR
jgi:Tfp pilus assembly protein PilF